MTDQNILNNGVINFFSGKKEYRSLSNFWENDIVIIDEDKKEYTKAVSIVFMEKNILE